MQVAVTVLVESTLLPRLAAEPKLCAVALTLHDVMTVAVTVNEYWLVLPPTGQLPADGVEPYCKSLLPPPDMLSEYEPGLAVC